MCMIDAADSYWDVSRVEHRTARKAYVCCECRRGIAQGERYWWVTGLYDGIWSVFRQCEHCHEAARWLDEVCGGWLWAGVVEDLGEHWAEEWLLHSVALGRLVLLIERRWERQGQLVPVERIARWVDDALAHVKRVQERAS